MLHETWSKNLTLFKDIHNTDTGTLTEVQVI